MKDLAPEMPNPLKTGGGYGLPRVVTKEYFNKLFNMKERKWVDDHDMERLIKAVRRECDQLVPRGSPATAGLRSGSEIPARPGGGGDGISMVARARTNPTAAMAKAATDGLLDLQPMAPLPRPAMSEVHPLKEGETGDCSGEADFPIESKDSSGAGGDVVRPLGSISPKVAPSSSSSRKYEHSSSSPTEATPPLVDNTATAAAAAAAAAATAAVATAGSSVSTTSSGSVEKKNKRRSTHKIGAAAGWIAHGIHGALHGVASGVGKAIAHVPGAHSPGKHGDGSDRHGTDSLAAPLADRLEHLIRQEHRHGRLQYGRLDLHDANPPVKPLGLKAIARALRSEPVLKEIIISSNVVSTEVLRMFIGTMEHHLRHYSTQRLGKKLQQGFLRAFSASAFHAGSFHESKMDAEEKQQFENQTVETRSFLKQTEAKSTRRNSITRLLGGGGGSGSGSGGKRGSASGSGSGSGDVSSPASAMSKSLTEKAGGVLGAGHNEVTVKNLLCSVKVARPGDAERQRYSGAHHGIGMGGLHISTLLGDHGRHVHQEGAVSKTATGTYVVRQPVSHEVQEKLARLSDELLVENTRLEAKRIFQEVDKDGSGSIDVREMYHALHSHGIPMSKSDVKRLFKAIDTSGDGQVDLEEFVSLLVAKSKKRTKMESVHGELAMLLPSDVGVIHPNALVMRRWDLLVIILLAYVAVVTPWEVAFLESSSTISALFVINRIVDFFFLVDIFISFRVQFPRKKGKGWVSDKRLIRNNYLTGWFAVDLLSILPFFVFELLGDEVLTRAARELFGLIRLVKLTRVLRVTRVLNRWRDQITLSFSVQALVFYAILIVVICHWLGCLWMLTAKMTRLVQKELWEDVGASWLDGYPNYVEDNDVWALYLVCLYWALQTISTIGYGDAANPSNSTEILIASMAMIIGSTTWAYIIGTICSLVAALDDGTHEYKEKMDRISMFVHDNQLSVEIHMRLREYFRERRSLRRLLNYQASG